MATIFELLDGANDVEITPCPKDRSDLKKMWDARSLQLFANVIDMSESAVSAKQLNASLSFAKGAVQASLSREAVEWVVFTVNLTTLMQQINKMSFGVDEILLESLQISDDIDMPGRFTSKCLAQGQNTDFITRHASFIPRKHKIARNT
ncbi:hypothetical protein ANCCAN_21336 [Ancylostoma caninum]|uniref:Uncharacterized protein n=1 Tax=Ancylostoma caninum TaxID=29170 RepID=A0A368FKZ5_ANCCA|nr:hypothetical protein ANCCAN_21336 [Ancylostoma caninum]